MVRALSHHLSLQCVLENFHAMASAEPRETSDPSYDLEELSPGHRAVTQAVMPGGTKQGGASGRMPQETSKMAPMDKECCQWGRHGRAAQERKQSVLEYSVVRNSGREVRVELNGSCTIKTHTVSQRVFALDSAGNLEQQAPFIAQTLALDFYPYRQILCFTGS